MMQQLALPSSSQVDGLATIWAIVEARKKFPAMIVVASATQGDDTASIARGLAQAAHGAGQRTGYLQLATKGRPAAPAPYAALSIAPRGSGRESFDAASADWRKMYDVVIIDAAALSATQLGAHVARVSDGVVIGVLDQRRVVAADRHLATLLGELRASVIGVVMTAPIVPMELRVVSRDRPRLEAATQQ